MQKNPKSNVLEKRKDLWFLTPYGVTDHLENLIKATTFPEKNPKNQKNSQLTYQIVCHNGDCEAHL